MELSEASSPAEIVGSIDDLLTEFFLRIPLKPLFRLKQVSKHWNSLISDPKLHSLRDKNKKPVGFIFQTHDPRVEFGKENQYVLSLDRSTPVGPPSIKELGFARKHVYSYKEYEVGNKIFHSCNGLLVGYLWAYEYDPRDYEITDYFVHNPTTGEHKSIPTPRDSWCIHWMYLAFDPSNSPHYKIICVLSKLSNRWTTKLGRQYKFAVYSSKTRSWKKYDNTFGSMYFKNGVYWNGSIHWISLSKTVSSIYFTPPDHDDGEKNVVVDDENDSDYDYDDDEDDACDSDYGYDENENDDDDNDNDADDEYGSDYDGDCGHHLKVLVMPTPPILEENSNMYFGESGDHLNFINYHGKDEYKFQVYEMRRDYSEWFVRYNVDVSNIWSRVWNEGLERFGCPKSFGVCGLVRIKKGDDEDGSFLVLLIKNRMVVYNVANGTFEIISEFDEDYYEIEYDLFRAFKSEFKNPSFLRMDCPLQFFESCLV